VPRLPADRRAWCRALRTRAPCRGRANVGSFTLGLLACATARPRQCSPCGPPRS
jgi:hypothetical protein